MTASNPGRVTFNEVGQSAMDRWKDILRAFGIAIDRADQHGLCPERRGKDRFGFDDPDDRCMSICSRGPQGSPLAGNRFDLLVHAGKASNEAATLRLAAEHLGSRPNGRTASAARSAEAPSIDTDLASWLPPGPMTLRTAAGESPLVRAQVCGVAAHQRVPHPRCAFQRDCP